MGRTSDAKERLLNAALDLIWKHSYGTVTVDAICERAGAGKGSFYYFFESKAVLAAAALHESWYACGQEIWDRIFLKSVPPLDRITGFMAFVYESQAKAYQDHQQVLGCPCFSVGSETSSEEREVSEKAREILSLQLHYFETAILDAQADGTAPPADAAAKAKCLFALFEGSLAQARIHNDIAYLRSLPDAALAMVTGISREPAAV